MYERFAVVVRLAHWSWQVKEIERESILSQATDEHEHQRLLNLINSDRDRAHKSIEGMAAKA